MNIDIRNIDHLVLTVADIGRTVNFYERVLGMRAERFGAGRVALKFGNQKINLHLQGQEPTPRAARPTPGSADLCLVTGLALERAMAHVRESGVTVLAGPVDRTGAMGPMVSFYFRDPDRNLIEIARYRGSGTQGVEK